MSDRNNHSKAVERQAHLDSPADPYAFPAPLSRRFFACMERLLACAKHTPGLPVGVLRMQLSSSCVCWSIRGLLRNNVRD
jgi:hypothetical protein